MTAPRGRLQRGEMMYRDINKKQQPQIFERTYLDDPRWDEIDERVITYLDSLEPDEWTREHWQIYKEIRKDRRNKLKLNTPDDLKQTSSEDLKASLTGSPSTSQS